MKESKGILNGCLMSIVIWALLILALTSCTTMRNSQRRHDRIVKHFPSVHTTDTIEVIDTVTITLEGFKDSNELIFNLSNDTIRDTIITQDSIIIVNTIYVNENGSNTLETTIEQPTRTITKEIRIKQPVRYVENKVYPHWLWWLVVLLVGFILGVLTIKKMMKLHT